MPELVRRQPVKRVMVSALYGPRAEQSRVVRREIDGELANLGRRPVDELTDFDVDAKFFKKLALERGPRFFAGFNLSTWKFPTTSSGLARCTSAGKGQVAIANCRRYNLERLGHMLEPTGVQRRGDADAAAASVAWRTPQEDSFCKKSSPLLPAKAEGSVRAGLGRVAKPVSALRKRVLMRVA